MEPVLLLILFLASSDPAAKERLLSFLSFYRENRALLAAVMQKETPVSEKDHSESAPQTKSRPLSEAGDLSILEEYLKRL